MSVHLVWVIFEACDAEEDETCQDRDLEQYPKEGPYYRSIMPSEDTEAEEELEGRTMSTQLRIE